MSMMMMDLTGLPYHERMDSFNYDYVDYGSKGLIVCEPKVPAEARTSASPSKAGHLELGHPIPMNRNWAFPESIRTLRGVGGRGVGGPYS